MINRATIEDYESIIAFYDAAIKQMQ